MKLSIRSIFSATTLIVMFFSAANLTAAAERPLKALFVTGQNNHPWVESCDIIVNILRQTSLFEVDTAITTSEGHDMSGFKPEFKNYDVVLLNYVGDAWPEQTNEAFVEYVKNGGGVVAIHSANNSFPNWEEYNTMLGLGGWEGRDERWGPYVYFKDGKEVRDTSPGPAGVHTGKHAFMITLRDKEHPITKGMPERWLHARDGLNLKMRGPAKNLHILATAYSDPSVEDGTDRDEAVLFTVQYGKGRVFHTILGNAGGLPLTAMQCTGFITSLQRGTEWAATGNVTQVIPEDFPTENEVRKWWNYKPPASLSNTDLPTVEFHRLSSWGMESKSPAMIEVVLSKVQDKTVTVDYATTETTKNKYEEDYRLPDGSLTFEKGQTSKNILLEIVNDNSHEPADEITIELSNPNNSSLGARRMHTYTINDDDNSCCQSNDR